MARAARVHAPATEHRPLQHFVRGDEGLQVLPRVGRLGLGVEPEEVEALELIERLEGRGARRGVDVAPLVHLVQTALGLEGGSAAASASAGADARAVLGERAADGRVSPRCARAPRPLHDQRALLRQPPWTVEDEHRFAREPRGFRLRLRLCLRLRLRKRRRLRLRRRRGSRLRSRRWW